MEAHVKSKSKGKSKSTKLTAGAGRPDLRRLAKQAEEARNSQDAEKAAIVKGAVEAIARSEAAAAEAHLLSTFLNEM
jgi:hypothetical protein